MEDRRLRPRGTAPPLHPTVYPSRRTPLDDSGRLWTRRADQSDGVDAHERPWTTRPLLLIPWLRVVQPSRVVSVLVSFRAVQQRSRPRRGITPPASRTAVKAGERATVALKSGRSAVRPRPCPPFSTRRFGLAGRFFRARNRPDPAVGTAKRSRSRSVSLAIAAFSSSRPAQRSHSPQPRGRAAEGDLYGAPCATPPRRTGRPLTTVPCRSVLPITRKPSWPAPSDGPEGRRRPWEVFNPCERGSDERKSCGQGPRPAHRGRLGLPATV